MNHQSIEIFPIPDGNSYYQYLRVRLHIGNRYLSHSGLNLYDNTARMHDPLLMRFTSPDPLASKYPDLSPWAHTAANPVNYIDIYGKDLYILNKDGTFNLLLANSNPYHTIESPKTGDAIDVNSDFFTTVTTTLGITADGTTYLQNIYSLENDGTRLFEFLANNSSVEWSHIKFNDHTSIVGTSHLEGQESCIGYYLDYNSTRLGKITQFDHSHPNGSIPSEGDLRAASRLENIISGIICRIYKVPNKSYQVYDSTTDISNLQEFSISTKSMKGPDLIPCTPIDKALLEPIDVWR